MSDQALPPGAVAPAELEFAQQGVLRRAWNLLLQAGFRLLPWAVVISIWYAIPYTGLVNPALVPTPMQVLAKFWELLTTQRLPLDIFMSTQRVLLGVACGIALAVPVGFVLGWYRSVRDLHRPADQLLPRAAADRADPAGHRLLRHRRAGQDRHPVLRRRSSPA